MSDSQLFSFTSGPRSAEIAIVGEAWGSDEAVARLPFVGMSGQELTRILAEAKIDRASCFITNVVPARPDNNELWRMFLPVKSGSPTYNRLHPSPIVKTAIENLHNQLRAVKPKVILALGNYAFWALSSEARVGKHPDGDGRLAPTGISDFRGSMLRPDVDGLRDCCLLPIYHPAAILRSWELRYPTVHDLRTRIPLALANDWHPTQPNARLDFKPTYEQTLAFLENIASQLSDGRSVRLACDIETKERLITCIGFATSETYGFTIPLVRKAEPLFASHWLPHQEKQITRLLCFILSHPKVELIGQNFLYDMTYFYRSYGLHPKIFWDTMSAQHLLFPGTQKDLGYLSSIYCKYHRYWKDDNKEWDMKADMDDHLRYNAVDCIRTFEIAHRQMDVIRNQKLDDLWALERDKYHMAFSMSMKGIRIDRQMKGTLSIELAEAASLRTEWLNKIIPQSLIDELLGAKQKSNWTTSPKQQKFVFFDLLGLPAQRHRKTGAMTLDKEALPKLKSKAPWASRIIDCLLELRSIGVFASTFVNAPIDPDGRMRTSFNPAGTETFRWSSSTNPFGTGGNFQNLPKGKEL